MNQKPDNIMRELNENEIKEVNGGSGPGLVRIFLAVAGALIRSGASDGEYLYNNGNFRKN